MKYNLIIAILILFSCKSDKLSTYEELDLLKYDIPVSIAAPIEAVVTEEDMGVMKDVVIKYGEDFYIQILSSDATSLDKTALLSSIKDEVKNGPFFSKIIDEDDDGFIFEKKIDEENINFDFRRLKIVGDKEIIFQTGMIGKFSEEAVRRMYKASK